MPAEPKTVIWYINLGGSVGDIGAMRYAWRGKKTSYKNIGDGLGVKQAKDTDTGLMFGANSPKPAKVRISYTDANTGASKTCVRFCEPDKIGDVTTGGKINSKKIVIAGVECNINAVEIKNN
ncbi:MAG: hypothetical protein V7K35_13325 [Nostoc sp.]|uniref:hypothetical protein n=1 Tax=Nostoc sp. TaxID=1180 RepID=UPI002FFAC58F